MSPTSLQFQWQHAGLTGPWHRGVSLHSHTCHSWENLRWLSRYESEWRVLPWLLKLAAWQHRRATGERLDLKRTFWVPPLAPGEALSVEEDQIQRLGLSALVSLTDHDDLESGLGLTAASHDDTPVSLEWTVPFGPTFFHLGVHNLPPLRARGIFAELRRYTARPSPRALKECLSGLNDLHDTLIVLNHPFWDEAGIGAPEHVNALRMLLDCCGGWIHEYHRLRQARPVGGQGRRLWILSSLTRPFPLKTRKSAKGFARVLGARKRFTAAGIVGASPRAF